MSAADVVAEHYRMAREYLRIARNDMAAVVQYGPGARAAQARARYHCFAVLLYAMEERDAARAARRKGKE